MALKVVSLKGLFKKLAQYSSLDENRSSLVKDLGEVHIGLINIFIFDVLLEKQAVCFMVWLYPIFLQLLLAKPALTLSLVRTHFLMTSQTS